jgi:hypothetical protein
MLVNVCRPEDQQNQIPATQGPKMPDSGTQTAWHCQQYCHVLLFVILGV